MMFVLLLLLLLLAREQRSIPIADRTWCTSVLCGPWLQTGGADYWWLIILTGREKVKTAIGEVIRNRSRSKRSASESIERSPDSIYLLVAMHNLVQNTVAYFVLSYSGHSVLKSFCLPLTAPQWITKSFSTSSIRSWAICPTSPHSPLLAPTIRSRVWVCIVDIENIVEGDLVDWKWIESVDLLIKPKF